MQFNQGLQDWFDDQCAYSSCHWQIRQVKVKVCLGSLLCHAVWICVTASVLGRSPAHLAVGAKWATLLVFVFFTCLSNFQVMKACDAKASLLQGSH